MFNKKIYLAFLLAMFTTGILQAAPVLSPAKPSIQATKPAITITTTPLQIVANPSYYLNKKVVITAKFDKFTTLGLDYKKAFRDSQKYIGFLVQRDDVQDHNVPLSELKMFMKRDYAEKFIDLNTGDKIKITGTVFSNALGDGWLDAEKIEVTEKVPSTK